MAATDRLVGSSITIAQVGTNDLTDKFRVLDHTKDVVAIDVGAVGDTRVHEKAGRIREEISLEAVIETTGVFRALIGTDVTFTADIAGTSMTGTGLLKGGRESSGGIDGVQTEAATISVHTVS